VSRTAIGRLLRPLGQVTAGVKRRTVVGGASARMTSVGGAPARMTSIGRPGGALKKRLVLLFGVLVLGSSGVLRAQEPPLQAQMDAAVLPLPTDLRAGAGVIRWVAPDRFEQLRPSRNGMSCSVDPPGDDQFDVRCYNDEFLKVIRRARELGRTAATRAEADELLKGEIERGEIALPATPTAGYRMLGPLAAFDYPRLKAGPEIARWQSIHFPFRTAAETGLTEVREPSEPALPGLMPFVMASGTWWSHVMIVHEPFD
jgi:hypothetical protein